MLIVITILRLKLYIIFDNSFSFKLLKNYYINKFYYLCIINSYIIENVNINNKY
jgi:hypothetical protein